jgi:hypothetical protein
MSDPHDHDQLPPPPGFTVTLGPLAPGLAGASNAPACSEGRHIWLWDEGQALPEGLPCECGAMMVHYERCPLCGSRKLTGRPYRGQAGET